MAAPSPWLIHPVALLDAHSMNNGTGGGAPGKCTGTSGILSDYEISRIIKDH